MHTSRDSSPNISIFSHMKKETNLIQLYKKELSCCVLDDTIRKDKVAFLFLAHQNRKKKKNFFRFGDAFFWSPFIPLPLSLMRTLKKNDKNLIKKVFGYSPIAKNRQILRNDEIRSAGEWIMLRCGTNYDDTYFSQYNYFWCLEGNYGHLKRPSEHF